MPFKQIRLSCLADKGVIFYASYNIRLFFYLLFKKMDGICAIDLDTILPVLWASRIKKVKRIYDAHELFCEMKEIVERPRIYAFWKRIERYAVPKFKYGYTVNEPIAEEFNKMYGSRYKVIRNMAVYDPLKMGTEKERFILYQGAVNEGRSFETLIPAMKWVNATLLICGDGNFMKQAQELARENDLSERVFFKGMLEPAELKKVTSKALIGITLFEEGARSNYFSLANRFFDYIHAGVPQICSDYPAYRAINNQYKVAVLVRDHSPESIAKAINSLLHNDERWENIHRECMLAARELNWQHESLKLAAYYQQIFG
jgi:glycosyltransferase involved in cell wall biosynthesis